MIWLFRIFMVRFFTNKYGSFELGLITCRRPFGFVDAGTYWAQLEANSRTGNHLQDWPFTKR
ncbi:hypothetical protein [Companilactobacillus farciminis]|uniref:hypothetical protein n=1 Tax=Companilactobacillus farciminis TaxID=1612 RepID=UPI0014768615|nr:hypothetical protein [Companilactobacillus farciminis]